MPRSAAIAIRVAALVAAAIALDRLCVEPYRGNLVLHRVEESSALARESDPQIAAIAARQNLAQLDDVRRSRRLDPAWYMLYAANLEALERFPEAADQYTRALRVDDRPELYFNRAMVRLHLGDTDGAVGDLAYAARFDPTVVEKLDGALRQRVSVAAGLP